MDSRHSVTCTYAARSLCCWLCSLDSSCFNCSVKEMNSVAWQYTASTPASCSSDSEDRVGDWLTVLDEDVLERPVALHHQYTVTIIIITFSPFSTAPLSSLPFPPLLASPHNNNNYDRPMEYGRPLYFHPVVCSIFFSSPNLSRHRLDVCHTFHTWCGLSANLRCRSETCCTRLAETQDAN